MELLKDININPDGNDISLWCDYIELRCLTHQDKRFSRSDLSDLIQENKDLKAHDDLYYDENENEPQQITVAEKADKSEGKISTYFRSLKNRQILFGDNWPFSIDNELQELSLTLPVDQLTLQKKLYIQLLLSSLLAYIQRDRRSELTGGFEYISKEIFASLMPKHSEVHLFAANNSPKYAGKLYNRLRELAKDFRGIMHTEERKFPSQGSGDWNIDLVAWHPMEDSRSHIPLALGQCGCSVNDWRHKMGDVSNTAKSTHLSTTTDWGVYYFLPQDFAQLEGQIEDWPDYKYGYFQRAIVIDRLRTVRLSKLYGILQDLPLDHSVIDEVCSIALT